MAEDQRFSKAQNRLHNIDEILGVDEPDDDGGGAAVAIARDSGGATKRFVPSNRSRSEELVFIRDRDFDPDPSGSWISQEYSETTPLFGDLDAMPSLAKTPPKDQYRFVWLVFCLLGMTTLLPWNFFISVNDYWNFKFRDPSGNATHTELQKEFTSYLAIASNIPNALFVLLNVFYGRYFKLNIRIIGALSLMSTLFIGVILMARINSDRWQYWFLYSTLGIVVLLNICTAVFQGGIIGVAGKFPPNYMGGMMSGQALGGIFPAIVNILVIAFKVEGADIGFYCFLVAFLFVITSLVVYCFVQTTHFFRHFARAGPETPSGGQPVGSSSLKSVFLVSWRYQVSVFVNFCASLAVFPSVTVLVTSQYRDDESNRFATTYFTPVTCFLLFNVGDYVGRILASFIKLPNAKPYGQNIVLTCAILRIGFIPLFLFCNAALDVRTLPVYFDKDADYYALMTMFSITNGYIGSICMMMGPKTATSLEDKESVATMLVSVLVLGIGLGSALSYPLVNLI